MSIRKTAVNVVMRGDAVWVKRRKEEPKTADQVLDENMVTHPLSPPPFDQGGGRFIQEGRQPLLDTPVIGRTSLFDALRLRGWGLFPTVGDDRKTICQNWEVVG